MPILKLEPSPQTILFNVKPQTHISFQIVPSPTFTDLTYEVIEVSALVILPYRFLKSTEALPIGQLGLEHNIPCPRERHPVGYNRPILGWGIV